MDFTQAQAEYQRLKTQVTAGQLTEDALKTRLQDLMVQDDQGRWWIIGFETGDWYVHESSGWVQAQPPAQAAPTVEPVGKVAAQAEPARKVAAQAEPVGKVAAQAIPPSPVAPAAQPPQVTASRPKLWLWLVPGLLIIGVLAAFLPKLLAPRAAVSIAPTITRGVTVVEVTPAAPATPLPTATSRSEATATPTIEKPDPAATSTALAAAAAQMAVQTQTADARAAALVAALSATQTASAPTATLEPTLTPIPQPTATVTRRPTIAATPTPQAPVVTTQPGVILDFESFGAWKRGNEPYGSFGDTAEQIHSGKHAGKLSYDFPAVNNNYVVFTRQPAGAISGQPDALSLWVFGDGSKHFLNVWILDSQGEVRQFTFGQIEHAQSWQQMTLKLDASAPWPQGHIAGPDNGRLDYPIRLNAIVLDGVPDGTASKGAIYVDDLMIAQSAG